MDNLGCKSYLVNEEPVVVVDWREDKCPGDDLWLDPPGLQVPGDIVHKQGVSQADVLPGEIHIPNIIFLWKEQESFTIFSYYTTQSYR